MVQEAQLTGTEKYSKRLGIGKFQRVTTWGFLVSAGIVASLAGLATVGYRMMYGVVDDGILNARVIRLQTPSDGYVKAMYVQPGVLVNADQILAEVDGKLPEDDEKRLRLQQSQQDDKTRLEKEILELEGQLQVNVTQLSTGQEVLVNLERQLSALAERDEAVQQVDIEIGADTLREQEAFLKGTVARAEAARLNYERHQDLVAEGAVSVQESDQLKLEWEAIAAEVDQAQALLEAQQAAYAAAQQGIARSNRNNLLGGVLSDQQNSLTQLIQSQRAYLAGIQAQGDMLSQRLNQARTLLSDRLVLADEITGAYENQQVQDVLAPHSGVIYSVEREQGERIGTSEQLLTMLDCNELWAEFLVSAKQAAHINPQTPVRVKLAGYSQELAGEVDLIQPINPVQVQNRSTQVQALNPTIPTELVGKPLARVTVRVPPPPQYTEAQQFCGVGQSARITFRKDFASLMPGT